MDYMCGFFIVILLVLVIFVYEDRNLSDVYPSLEHLTDATY